jgi:hypothetical protein
VVARPRRDCRLVMNAIEIPSRRASSFMFTSSWSRIAHRDDDAPRAVYP